MNRPASVTHRCRRFLLLWCSIFVAVVLLACIEGIVFYISGFRYVPKSSISFVQVTDFSIDTTGAWAAARVKFRRNDSYASIRNEFVLIDLRRQDVVRLELDDLLTRHVVLSPDGNSLAIGCIDGSIYYVEDPSSGTAAKKRQFAKLTAPKFARLVFSPDSGSLAAMDAGKIYVWDWSSGDLLFESPHNCTVPDFLAFSADSKRLLFVDQSGLLTIREVAKGVSNQTSLNVRQQRGLAILSPQLIAITQTERDFTVTNPETDRESWSANASTNAIAVSDDSRLIASCVKDHSQHFIRIYDSANGKVLCDLESDKNIRGFTFGPNGLLYSRNGFGLIQAWNIDEQCEEWSFSLFDWAQKLNDEH